MSVVMISFVDGETLYADVEDLTFDVPVLEARVRNVDSNSDRALVPLAGIRQIIVGETVTARIEEVDASWERAVFRFLDGQVLRSFIAPEPMLGRHGGIWRCVEPGADEEHRIGIPYNALKAVFEVREWDSRAVAERAPGDITQAETERLARILVERAGEEIGRTANQALLTRVRRPVAP